MDFSQTHIDTIVHNIFTNMIDFVTWPPFLTKITYYIGGQMTNPVMLVKICYKLLYVQEVKTIIDKVTFWPQLISKILGLHLPVCNAASDWPHAFLYVSRVFFVYYSIFIWTSHYRLYSYLIQCTNFIS